MVIAGAGLPNLPGLLMDVKTYSERLFSYRRVGTLSPGDAAEALERPAETLGVSWQPAAVDRVVEDSAGYPYFLQLFGKSTWDFAPGPDTIGAEDAAVGVIWARRDLNANFYGIRWQRATPAQRAFLSAMAAEAGDADAAVSTRRIAARLDNLPEMPSAVGLRPPRRVRSRGLRALAEP